MAVFNGGSFHDFIPGTASDDWINGHSGNDTLIGGPGEDTLLGGSGNDRLIGDGFIFNGNDVDEVSASFIETIPAGCADDYLDGGFGNDTLEGGEGADTLLGGAGNDLLKGGWGDDWMEGNSGVDTLKGGAGSDTMNGGSGPDLYVYKYESDSEGCEADLIQGWDWTDIIDVRCLGYTDILPYEDIVALSLSCERPLFYAFEDGDTIVFDIYSDFRIVIEGEHELTDADFLFADKDDIIPV